MILLTKDCSKGDKCHKERDMGLERVLWWPGVGQENDSEG